MSNLTTTIKTITLKNGEKALFPSGAVIKSVIKNGNIAVSSSCSNLPPVSTYRCYRFSWEDNDSGPYGDGKFTSIVIGGTVYNLSPDPVSGINNSYDTGGDFLTAAIPLAVPTGLVLMQANAGGTAVNPKCIVIKIPDNLGAPELRFKNPEVGGLTSWMAFEAEADICDCTTVSPATNP